MDLKNENVKASLIYIDCDLYTSSKTVLDFIAQSDLLQDGTIIAFDDWDLYRANPNKGQRKAFKEFKEKINGGGSNGGLKSGENLIRLQLAS
ncbi:hypothetical protein [Campylobacter fetus]|uniref:hypothetical protein n=1 Tax=Campylobacter fetus TaxID=196 RepID=UPI0008187DEE|nr:hypothetical protein [Campylobacter fetus]OCR92398.1 hypothetical protein CFT12S02263_06270 [Campylobacter fetus subsp. testudinum]